MVLEVILLDKIVEDPDQPRRALDESALIGLADSVRQLGLLNPITVVPMDGVDAYRIVTGERRWRASKLAGLTEIPCLVRESPTSDSAEKATEQLIENLQREELSPVDKANAIRSLKTILGATNREVGQRLGISERTVGYLLDLLDLPETISEQIVSSPNRPADGNLTEKHARFLRQLNDSPDVQQHLVEKIRGEKLSGDDTARVAKALKNYPDQADAILESPVAELPSLLGLKQAENTSFSVGGAFVKIVERIPESLDELKIDRVSGGDLAAIEAKLLAARDALDKKLAEVRSAIRATADDND